MSLRPIKKHFCASFRTCVAQGIVDLKCESAHEFGCARASDVKTSGGRVELTFW